MKYITRSNDRNLSIYSLEEAKAYCTPELDLEFFSEEEKEELKNYYEKINESESLEELAQIWNDYTDRFEDGSRLFVEEI